MGKGKKKVDLKKKLKKGKLTNKQLEKAGFDENTEELDVSRNTIGYEGVVVIHKRLQANKAKTKKQSLKKLNLENNDFTNEDIRKIEENELITKIKKLMHTDGEIDLEEGNGGLKLPYACIEKKDKLSSIIANLDLDEVMFSDKPAIEYDTDSQASANRRKSSSLLACFGFRS